MTPERRQRVRNNIRRYERALVANQKAHEKNHPTRQTGCGDCDRREQFRIERGWNEKNFAYWRGDMPAVERRAVELRHAKFDDIDIIDVTCPLCLPLSPYCAIPKTQRRRVVLALRRARNPRKKRLWRELVAATEWPIKPEALRRVIRAICGTAS